MIAVVLRHGMPIAQIDLALLVPAPVFCSPVGMRLSKSGSLLTPPVVVLTDPTPAPIIGDCSVVRGLDILDGSQRTTCWWRPDERDLDHRPIPMPVLTIRGWPNASTAAAAAAAAASIGGRGRRKGCAAA